MDILVADDEITTRSTLHHILQRLGHSVRTASDGEEAWSIMLEESVPRIVILDWMMPKMNGLELSKKIQSLRIRPLIYIILLTIRDTRTDMLEGFAAGIDDFMAKPFDYDVLQARIHVAQRTLNSATELANRVKQLENAKEHIRTLQEILPICMHCHSIKTDEQSWQRIEDYLNEHDDVMVSHDLCPSCLNKYHRIDETQKRNYIR